MRNIFIIACFCLSATNGIHHFATGSSFFWESTFSDVREKKKTVWSTITLQSTISRDFMSHYPKEEVALGFNFYKVSRNLVIVFFGLFVVFGILIVREFLNVAREEEAKMTKRQLQADLEFQTRQELKERLQEKERQLAMATLALEEKNKMLTNLKSDLQEIQSDANVSTRSKLRPINRSIEDNLQNDQEWVQFQLQFSQVHPHFFNRLKDIYPSLNNNDLRLCAYLRLQLPTKEIAYLMHINQQSVQKARYRLKKKLVLPSDSDLVKFISSV